MAQWLEHRSADSEGLRFDSLRGLRMFSLSHSRDKKKKHLSPFLYRAKNLPSLLFISTNITHYAFDITDPSSMQDACHMNFVVDLAHRTWILCGSVVRASERRFRRTEVRFLKGTQNFFFVPCLSQDKKTSFSIAFLMFHQHLPRGLLRR